MNNKPKRTYPWQRRRRRAVVAVILFCGLVLTPWFAYRWTQAIRLQQAVDAVHAVGLPASSQELEAVAPPSAVPDKPPSGKTAPVETSPVAEDTVAITFPELVPSTGGPVDRPTLKNALSESSKRRKAVHSVRTSAINCGPDCPNAPGSCRLCTQWREKRPAGFP
jgi:hypothetical protein